MQASGQSCDPAGLPAPLRRCVDGFTALADAGATEQEFVQQGGALLAALVARDDWLPPAQARPDPQYYRQYLLYRDPAARFSIVSFVWGPGQHTPVHNHTVWGLIGMLRGAETAQDFAFAADGGLAPCGPPQQLAPGAVAAVSPTLGDIHQVRNAHEDRVSISIHVYGADIGAVDRSVFAMDGTVKPFRSGYSIPA